ncbi:MFS transporter [Microvirga lotononidis]|uniref:Arabinose efflux permease family protein n=1 Tax=Microvirga lotononidis TaxID=864069 RepID=I4YW68_9HYPH|nr:MFS transporter [Microvirga lotononidis]EIM28210.1 arabinose efflux permease family protein [Microvirga lotononidis]WQO27691.1 MFS transporter [Microvirga lotononidis]
MHPFKALEIRLGALQAASFTSHGMYLPFFPLWLQSKALSPTVIGFVVAIPIIVRILATAPLMSLADRSFGARRLLLASHFGQLIGFPLFLLVDATWAIMALVALVAVAQSCVIPGNDLVSTNAVQKHPGLNYGRIRGSGSVAFFITNIVGGYLVGAFGPDVVIVVLTIIPILGITATLVAVPHERSESSSHGEPRKDEAPSRLSRILWLVLIAGAVTQASHGALNAFASIYWRSVGFSDQVIGYFWAAGVIAEILVFVYLGRHVGRNSGIGLIMLGSAAAVIRFTIMSLQPGTEIMFVLQTMHSLTFAATHIGTMAALAAFAPMTARGRAQGIYGSLAALTTAASTIVSGLIYTDAGAGVFAAMAPLGAIAFVLMLMAVRLQKDQPQRAGSGG